MDAIVRQPVRKAVAGLSVTIASVLACAAVASAAQNVAPERYARGPATESLTDLVEATGANGSEAANVRYAYLRKLDSHLQELAADRLENRDLSATAEDEALELSGGERRVTVDVYVDGDMAAAERALRAQGMEIAAVSDREPQRLVEGTLPIGSLTSVAGLESTQAVLAVQGFGTNAGSVLSQGDAAHRGPQARSFGPSGAGVTVGVISDSINRVGAGVAGSQASGDLPGPASSPPGQVQVLLDGTPGSSDEGRAMAEIVFDTAPGIRNMLFTTGQGAATRARGIDNLVAAGAKVIADDTFQITEPFFQDGIIAQAVDRAKAAGVTYLVSAGNRARQSWEGTYAPTTDPRGVSPSANDFDTEPATDAIQTVGTFTDRRMFVSLQWDEPFNAASTDLAVDVFQIVAGTPTYAFTVDTDNIATRVPAEFVQISVTGTATLGISIRRKSGVRSPFMKYIVGGTQTFTIAEHNTSSNAIDPDASSARGALTVAASPFGTPAVPEPFSSRGQAFKLFDVNGNRLAAPEVRAKPDLAAADGVATSVPGFNPFFGTSAAAPSAAGIAALILSAKPGLSVDATAAILKDPNRAIDCTTAPGLPDFDCGFGFVLADAAVSSALDTSPPTIAPFSPPIDGANGWYTRATAGVVWTASDADSPTLATNGCEPRAFRADGTVAFTCTATSVGGTATQTVTLKRDGSPPTTPAFSGIAPRSFAARRLPRARAIRCAASDPTSGVTGCTVTGYSTRPGPHTLTATATNGAGLTSTATLSYRVLRPAISALRGPRGRPTLADVLRDGISATLKAAGRRTRLKVRLIVGRQTVASLTKTVRAGRVRVHLDLTQRGRSRVQAQTGNLKLKVTGRSSGFGTTTLTTTVRPKR